MSCILWDCNRQPVGRKFRKANVMKTRDIKQRVTIHATPSAVYEALMDQEKHSQFTGEPAEITAKRGAAFACYDGYIEGFNLDLEPGRLIVQAWRSEDW